VQHQYTPKAGATCFALPRLAAMLRAAGGPKAVAVSVDSSGAVNGKRRH